MSHHFRDQRTSTTDRAWKALAAAACGGAVFFGTLPAQADDGIGLWKKPTAIRSARPENGFATSIRSFLAQSQQQARAGQWAAAEALAQRAQRMSIAAAPSLKDYPDCQPDAIAQALASIGRKEVPTGIAMAPLPASTVIQVIQPPAQQNATMPAPQPTFPAAPRYENTFGAPQVARISAAPVQPAGPGEEAPVELTNSIVTAPANEQDIPPSPAPAVPAPAPTVAQASAASEPAATSDSPAKAQTGSNEAKRHGALPAWKPVEAATSRHVVEIKPGAPAIRPATGTSFFQSSRFTVVANQSATAKKPVEAPRIEETATVDESIEWFASLPELPEAEELSEDELFVPVRPLPTDPIVWAQQPVDTSSVVITPAKRPKSAPPLPESPMEEATLPVAMANEGASIRVLEWKSVNRPGSQEVITAELSASPSTAVAPTPDADKTTAGNTAADETIEQTGFRDGDWTVNTTTSTGGFAFERPPLELARSPLSEDDAVLFAPSVIVDRTPVSADGLLLDEPQPTPAAGESTWFDRFSHGKSIPRQTVIAFSLAVGLLILLSITSFIRRRSSR
ncbi:MAG: hypothetical protein KF777_20835 [Planctomycetaceae bacterium]|nr:hypothetical protein [Planctomycetaceae bacterium]